MTVELQDRIKTLEKANKQCQIGVIILAITVTFGGLWLYRKADTHHQLFELQLLNNGQVSDNTRKINDLMLWRHSR